MNSKDFFWYKILLGFFRSIKCLGLGRFFDRLGFGLYYLLRYKLQYRIKVINPHVQIPSPCIFTINHVADEDTVIIQTLNELFFHHLLSLLFAQFNFERNYAPYISWVNGISDKGSGSEVIERMAKAIGNGRSIAIWPEGTLSRTGSLMKFFTGVSRLYILVNYGSLESPCLERIPKIPLVPIFLEGVFESLNPFDYAIRKRKRLFERYRTSKVQWQIIVGKPYYLSCPDHITKASLEDLTEQIQEKILELDPIKRSIASNPRMLTKRKNPLPL